MTGGREAAVAESGRERAERVRERLRTLLGPDGAEGRTAAPASDEETGAVLRVAGDEGWRVLPAGAGLAPGPGFRAAAGPDVVLSTRRRRGVLEYEPADLTLTVEAGTSLAELDREVRGQGQWLPLDPPGPAAATLGGVFATGLGGPLSFGFGRPRDQLLGLTLVDGRGQALALGGRVVKNVAGFDLVRLAAGSRGSLGVITRVSLRLFPVPAADRALAWERGGWEEAWTLGRRLAGLPLPLAALEVVVGPRGPDARVVARALGSPGAVAAMTRELEGEAGEVGTRLEGDRVRSSFEGLAEQEGRGALVLRARSLPSRGGDLLEGAAEMARELGGEARIALRPGTGELRLDLSPPEDGRGEAWVRSLGAFRRRAEEAGGSFRLVRAPGSVPAEVVVHTPPGPGADRLGEALRRAFDPRGILPGAWRGERR